MSAHLARRPEEGFSVGALQSFFNRSLTGQTLADQVQPTLNWLTDPYRMRAFKNEQNRYRLTVLGLKATRAVLPLQLSSGFAQLMRDLLTVDPTDRLLSSWKPLDHLIVLSLLHDRLPQIRPFSKKLVNQVDTWMEQNPSKVPLLYREWIAGQPGASKAAELLGSLAIEIPETAKSKDIWARKSAYQSVFHAIVLYERGQGKAIETLTRRWQIKNLGGIEERWRDDYLWLLSGMGHLLDIRAFYFHLREECGADTERVK